MGRANETEIGPSSRSIRRPMTKGRLLLFSILLVATIIMGVMVLYLLGSPGDIAVADVMPDPEGSESFFLKEGKFEVWHLASSPPAQVEIWGPGNHRYFRGYAESGSDSVFWGSDEYRMIGTFEADEGKYRARSQEGDNVLITDTTTVWLITLVFGVLLFATIVYYIYITPPKKNG